MEGAAPEPLQYDGSEDLTAVTIKRTPCSPFTNISEEPTASIFRVEKINQVRNQQAEKRR
jgi:hypothetical protein